MAIACTALLGVVFCFTSSHFINRSSEASASMVAGGNLHSACRDAAASAPVINREDDTGSERFQRPSKALPYPNPYSFKDFETPDGTLSADLNSFDNPEDLILAYYGILRDASNMLGYWGGCGTIGMAELPYPYAYELLTKEKQKTLSPDQFADSFKGIGYTTLLKLLPAYAPPGTPQNTKYYMVEMEVITGAKVTTEQEHSQGSRFAYYYGLITVEETPNEGWKVKDIDYIAEDFLCAPMHGWFYLADAVVQIVYEGNLQLVDKTDKTEQKDCLISIYASGKGKSYRFDFVRLTNGYDILLHEYVLENGAWRETSLLTDDWKDMKLTVNNSQLS